VIAQLLEIAGELAIPVRHIRCEQKMIHPDKP
jgi:hypothetical protein